MSLLVWHTFEKFRLSTALYSVVWMVQWCINSSSAVDTSTTRVCVVERVCVYQVQYMVTNGGDGKAVSFASINNTCVCGCERMLQEVLLELAAAIDL
jgi:hypothetical protein